MEAHALAWGPMLRGQALRRSLSRSCGRVGRMNVFAQLRWCMT